MYPTIYKRPHVYNSNVYKRYGVNAGGIGVYKLPYGTPQEYTNENVPAGLKTIHDFGDGLGPVPAVPYDNAAVDDSIQNFETQRRVIFDNAAVDDSIQNFETQHRVIFDNAAVDDSILTFEVLDNA